MENTNRDDIVLLFDFFNMGSQDLLASFQNADFDIDAVVINDDGFLPDSVENVYEYFINGEEGAKEGKPLFFNQIEVPEYWEIRGTNSNGSVYDKTRERARIFYAEPKHKRLVKVVDWISEDGNVRASDHYNKYGRLYARTIFNKKAQRVSKSYFNSLGQEIIVENFVTGDIILNDGDAIRFFKNKTEFVVFYFKRKGLDHKRIFFNSLSTPFFVSNALPAYDNKKGDVLFWQEPTHQEIPGNMLLILDGNAPRCDKVVVQNHQSYDRLLQLNANEAKMEELGFIYSFKKKNMGRRSALICTNTENVEKLKELAEALPEVKFHVAALTEMSAKLMAHEKYENVVMYPNVKMSVLDKLFWDCDFYLDINHEGEIVEATRRAFLHNQIILCFNETAHGLTYTATENRFTASDYRKMVYRIKGLLKEKDKLTTAVYSQQRYALTATVEDYQRLR